MYKLLLTTIIATILSSCGGSGGGSNHPVSSKLKLVAGSGSDSNQDNNKIVSISGKVNDLNGAKVCSDQNGDKVCQDSEPQTMSTAGGAYTLKGKNIENYPIIAQALAETINENTKTAIGSSNTYTLSAPKGKKFIGPITTMIQDKIDSAPTLDADSAALLVAQGLKIAIDASDLYDDYTASDKNQKASNKIIHQAAQAIALVMSKTEKALKDKFSKLGLTLDDDMKKLIAREVKNAVSGLAADIFIDAKTYTENSVNADKSKEEKAAHAATFVDNNNDIIADIANKFDTKEKVQQQMDNVNNKAPIEIYSAKEFLAKGDIATFSLYAKSYDSTSTSASFYKKYQELNINTLVFSDNKLYEDSGHKGLSTATFSADYYKGGNGNSLTEKQAIAKLKKSSESSESYDIIVNNDGSIQFKNNFGSTVKLLKIAQQSIKGLTFLCGGPVMDNDSDAFCRLNFSYIIVRFTEGDYQYNFTFQTFGRFNTDTVNAEVAKLSFDQLCPSISSISDDRDDRYCRKYDKAWSEPSKKYWALYSQPAAGAKIRANEDDKYIYYWSENGKSIEVCDYIPTDVQGNETCTSAKINIGSVDTITLTSGEKVLVYPAYIDGDVDHVPAKLILVEKSDSIYEVKSIVTDNKVPFIRSLFKFNWDAYLKVFAEFLNI